MKKYLILIVFLLTFIVVTPAYGQEKASVSSAQIALAEKQLQVDNRAKILRSFFNQNNSPLADNAEDFIINADKYNLDWKLVAAISGVESTFGQEIPPGSYNGWGWGVYGTNVHYFNSWQDGIETVSQGLRETYMNKWGAKDIYEVGSMYAASPAWASHVEHFMNVINEFALKSTKDTLSLSL